MVELLKDERKIVKRGDKFIFYLEQQQEYPQEAVEQMIESWKKEVKEKEEWLKNKDKLIKEMNKAAKKEIKVRIEQMEEQVKSDIASAREAIKLWTNYTEE